MVLLSLNIRRCDAASVLDVSIWGIWASCLCLSPDWSFQLFYWIVFSVCTCLYFLFCHRISLYYSDPIITKTVWQTCLYHSLCCFSLTQEFKVSFVSLYIPLDILVCSWGFQLNLTIWLIEFFICKLSVCFFQRFLFSEFLIHILCFDFLIVFNSSVLYLFGCFYKQSF